MKRIFVAFVLVMAWLFTAAAQDAVCDTSVYFVNVYPGGDIYELEGHSAILVDIPGREPVAYNFGVFDFEAPNFVYRFVKGETDYRAVAWPWRPFVMPYIAAGRRVVARKLNFDSAQTARLVALLETNVLPENAVYRYNYVKDNCATRPLRAVELAAGDTLQLGPALIEADSFTQPTFRNVMRRYHRNYPWYQFGIDLALGSGIDYRLSRRELAFAPAELDGMLASATSGGNRLVSETKVVADFAPDNAVAAPTPWFLRPETVFGALLLLAICLTVRDVRRRKVTRWFDAVFFGVVGVTGLVLTFLIFVSEHEATSPNLLYVWVNPLNLLVPALLWIKSAKKVLVCYQIVNFALLLILLCCWPFASQSGNPAFLPIAATGLIRSFSYVYISLTGK